MGREMAASLLSAGHHVVVYNRSRERTVPLSERGARVVESPADVARGAEIVLSMLADDAAVEGVAFGQSGLIAGLGSGAIHVSCSTISVELSERLAAAHANVQQGFIAAPVFGRPEAATAKQLWVIAAGAPNYLNRCMPVLEAVGRGVTRLEGAPSRANVVKLAGNFLIASTINALGEAFALTQEAGVARETFLDVFSKVFGRSPIFENYAKVIASEAFEPPGFKLSLGAKDLRLALAAAESLRVPMPQASLVYAQFLTAMAQGKGDLDWSAIAR